MNAQNPKKEDRAVVPLKEALRQYYLKLLEQNPPEWWVLLEDVSWARLPEEKKQPDSTQLMSPYLANGKDLQIAEAANSLLSDASPECRKTDTTDQ